MKKTVVLCGFNGYQTHGIPIKARIGPKKMAQTVKEREYERNCNLFFVSPCLKWTGWSTAAHERKKLVVHDIKLALFRFFPATKSSQSVRFTPEQISNFSQHNADLALVKTVMLHNGSHLRD